VIPKSVVGTPSARIAQTSFYPEAREQFADLAKTWLRLAADLENAQALIDALNESEPKRRTG
jgi:hypothetical protein